MMIRDTGIKLVKMVVSVCAASAENEEFANESAVNPMMPGVRKRIYVHSILYLVSAIRLFGLVTISLTQYSPAGRSGV